MFASFRDEILINGVIRELDLIHHPKDIIVIIHRYYEQLGASSFIIREQQRDCIYRNNFWWKISEKTVDSTQDNSINHKCCNNRRCTIYPHEFNPWYQPLTHLSDYDKYSHSNQLQYHFAIQPLADIRRNIYIGIIPYRYGTGHCSYFVQTAAGPGYYDEISFTVEKYPDFSNKPPSYNYKTNTNKLLCFAYAKKGNSNNDIISINIDCFNRKVYFLWNDEIIHTLHVQVNIPYIPVVWYKNDHYYSPQKIEYKILSMSSYRMANKNAICHQSANVDLQRFVYRNLYSLEKSEYSANEVIDLLWRGYTLICDDRSHVDILELRFISEIHKYFYHSFLNHVEEILSKNESFGDCYQDMYISSIITHYVIDANYNHGQSLNEQQYDEMGEWIQRKLEQNEHFTWNDCDELFSCLEEKYYVHNSSDCTRSSFVELDKEDIDDYSEYMEMNKLCELAIDYNHSKDNHRKGHLYDDTRYKMKDKRNQISKKRKKDRVSNRKSKLKFQQRYQMLLQY